MSTRLKRENKHKFICISCFLVLWIIQALRATTIGTDVNGAYVPYFMNLNATIKNFLGVDFFGFEQGFRIYCSVINLVSKDPNIFLAITSFVILVPISYIIYKYSRNPILSFIIFSSFIIYHFSFSGLRQAMAISLIVLSYKFVIERKLIVFIGIILLASTFHVSALSFFIAYPLYKLNLSNKQIMSLLILGVACIYFIKPLVLWITPIVFGADKYIGYINKDSIPSYNLLVLLIAILVFVLNKKKKSTYQFLNSLILMSIFAQALGVISSTASRLAYYFFVFIMLAIPEAIELKNLKLDKRYTYNITVACFMIFFFFYTNSNGYLDVIPYKFFWE